MSCGEMEVGDLANLRVQGLGKFAQIVLALTATRLDDALARTALQRLKNAFDRFANNQQKFPLVYDSKLTISDLSGLTDHA